MTLSNGQIYQSDDRYVKPDNQRYLHDERAVWRWYSPPQSSAHRHRMQFLKKSKKPRPLPQPLGSGIPSHIGDVVPLGSSAEPDPDIGSEGTLSSAQSYRRLFDLTTVAGPNNGGGSQVALQDNRDGRSYESGAPTSTTGQDEAPILLTATHEREHEQGTPPNALGEEFSRGVSDLSSPEKEPEGRNQRGCEDKGTFAERPTNASPGQESKHDRIGQGTHGFGSLKAALEAVSDVYAHREVRVRKLSLDAHTNKSAGNQPHWKQGQRHGFVCRCTREAL